MHWIKVSNPNIYRIYDEKGNWKLEVCDHAYQHEIDDARKKGLRAELQDNSKLIKELEADIKRVERRIEEHKANCKGYIFRRMEDGTVGYFLF